MMKHLQTKIKGKNMIIDDESELESSSSSSSDTISSLNSDSDRPAKKKPLVKTKKGKKM